MIVAVPSIQPPLGGVVPSLATGRVPDTVDRGSRMTLSIDERIDGTMVVRAAGTIAASDVAALAEALGEATEQGRALHLDLSSAGDVAPGVHSVLDAIAIRLGRWNQQLTVVLPPALMRSGTNVVPSRAVVLASPASIDPRKVPL